MPNKKDLFVIMPFSGTATCTESQWLEIYENVFKPAVVECGYSCERATPSTGSLIRSIVERLRFSRIVIADITDRNPNVFYELGVRHSLSKRTIIVAQGDSHLPSDLRGYWYTSYGTRPGQVTQFKRDVKRLITAIENAPDRSDSPVSDYLEQENLSVSSYIQKENVKKLGALYTECTGNLLQLSALLANKPFDVHVTHDCLGLLLQSLYVDIGPELLKVAYELNYKLRTIEYGRRDERFVKTTIEDLESLSTEILAIRTKLMSGQYEEPSTISTMIWRPGEHAQEFLSLGLDYSCANLSKEAFRHSLDALAEARTMVPRHAVTLISQRVDFPSLIDLTARTDIERGRDTTDWFLKRTIRKEVKERQGILASLREHGLAKTNPKPRALARKKKLRTPKRRGS